MSLPLSIIQPGIYSAGKKIVPAFNWGSAGYYFATDKALVAFDPATDTLLRRDYPAGEMVGNIYNLAYIPGIRRLMLTCYLSATSGGMYYSDDWGLTWTKAPASGTWDAVAGYIPVKWVPAQNQLIAAKSVASGARDIIRSTDGINYTAVAGPGGAGLIHNYQVMPINQFGDVGFLQFNGGENRAFAYNTDNVASSTWGVLGIGISSAICSECPNGDFVAYGTTVSGSARIRSTNGGQTWAADGTPLANMVNVSSALSRMIMFAPAGRYYSDNNAIGGWTLMTPSLSGGAAQVYSRKDVNDFLIIEMDRTIRKTNGITMTVSPAVFPADLGARGGQWINPV